MSRGDGPLGRAVFAAVGDGLRLQILGPLQLWRGAAAVDPGPPQQAHLLAVLLARAGRPTTTDELIDIVWGEASPSSALNTLHKYIGALRHILEPDLEPRRDGSYLQRRSTGYVFTAGEGTLDLVAFHLRLSAARVSLAEQRYEPALDGYIEALGLWTGPAGVGLDSGLASASIFAMLNAEFVDNAVAATALAISVGQPERVLPFLHQAASMSPLHESVQASLISALGASGQRAEALATFHAVRIRLAEQLGIDPGQALIEAHRRVLDPLVGETGGRSGTAARNRGQQEDRAVAAEPYRVADFHGRGAQLEVIRSFVETGPWPQGQASMLLISGPPGVGKTTTALEALHRATIAGSRLFVNLHGFDVAPLTPTQVLRALLAQVHKDDAPPGSFDEASVAWRAATAATPLIVMLDNASSESQVRSVLAADGPLTVVVTSRRTLPGLETTERIVLGPLPRDESEGLLADLIPKPRRLESNLAELAVLCGDFPLALRIAGARVASRPQWSLDDFIDRLRDERARLQQLTAGDLAIETAFSLSYDALDPAMRRLFRSLAQLHGATFTARMVAAIDDLDPYGCRNQLEGLADLGLVEIVSGDRYRMHDLLRVYASDRLRDEVPEAEVRDQQLRLDRWVLETTTAAAKTLPYSWAPIPVVSTSSREELQAATDWLTIESSHWHGALQRASDLGEHRLVVDTTMALTEIANVWEHFTEWTAVHSLGADSAELIGDSEAYVVQLIAIAIQVPGESPDPGDAVAAAERALETAESGDNPRWIALARSLLAEALFDADDVEGARRESEAAQAQYIEIGELNGELDVRSWRLNTLLDDVEGPIEAASLMAVIAQLGPHPQRVLQSVTLLNCYSATVRLFLRLSRFEEALDVATRMMDLEEPLLAGGGYIARANFARGFALLGLKEYGGARVALEAALSWKSPYKPDSWISRIQDALDSIPAP